jgi:transposase
MKQRPVVLFATLKGVSLRDIHTELESAYMDQALCLPTVYKWHERFMQRRTELFDGPRSGRPWHNDLADVLRGMIQEFPFTLCKRLWTDFRLAMTTSLLLLRAVLCLKKFNLRWVYDSFDNALKAERVSLSTDLLLIPKADQKNGFAQVITGGESWFYFDDLHQSV